jgi:RNA polymerase-binding transcription factor DksA
MYEKQKKKLKKLKKELEKRIKEIKLSLMKKRSKDWEEAAVEAENDEVLEGVYTESARELLQVKHALQRIKQGGYMQCEECGADINPKRLKIMPYTTICIECAQSMEFEYKLTTRS